MPGYAGAPSGTPATPPQEVGWASKILFGLAGLGIINTLVSFTMRDEIRDIVRDENPSYSGDEVDSAVNGILGFAVVFGIVFALIYVLLARKVLQGRRWARVVATILLALNALNLAGLSRPQPGVLRVLSAIAGLAAVAALVFLWRQPSKDFFRAQGQAYG
jgi:cytochrome c biogenesis protein CcdA